MSDSTISLFHTNQISKVIYANNDFLIRAFQVNQNTFYRPVHKTIYGFIAQGSVSIKSDGIDSRLGEGTYFSISENLSLEISPNSMGIIIETNFSHVLNMIGGPVEKTGRLKYIDGCSDTLLISPAKLGEPCLNLLHFPANTIQTMHHHPSFRFGMVVTGAGESVSQNGKIALKAGDVFFIPENVEHKFNTFDSEMNVIAFHPDSDWGPTDEVHPMKNRTWFKS